MENTTITISNEANLNTNGTRTSRNCKPVVCIDTGEVYNSCTDAAEMAGVSVYAMSLACIGKSKTTKGKRYCYLNERDEHLDTMLARIRELSVMEEKAKLWDAQQAEIEEARKAEEKRLAEIAKAEETHRKAIEKAKAKVERLRAEAERRAELYHASLNKLNDAETALEALQDNNVTEMEAVA